MKTTGCQICEKNGGEVCVPQGVRIPANQDQVRTSCGLRLGDRPNDDSHLSPFVPEPDFGLA